MSMYLTLDQQMPLGIQLVSLVVDDYDEAIDFFVQKLGFVLTEDSPATSTVTGLPKRWVTVHPAQTAGAAILLAQANTEQEKEIVGKQWAGRVGMFLHVEDFETQFQRMKEAGVIFLEEPRDETYGRVVVFRDVAGNKWDLIGSRKHRQPVTQGDQASC